jgi:hypothetical protein
VRLVSGGLGRSSSLFHQKRYCESVIVQVLSLGQTISIALPLKKTILCLLSSESLKVTSFVLLIFSISETVFSKKYDLCPQSQ